jgi:hypothetical protein
MKVQLIRMVDVDGKIIHIEPSMLLKTFQDDMMEHLIIEGRTLAVVKQDLKDLDAYRKAEQDLDDAWDNKSSAA